MTTDQQSMDDFLDKLMEELSTRVAAKLIALAPHPDRLYTPEEAAERLRVSERHVRQLTAELKGQPPKLASVKVEGSRRIFQRDLDAYLARNRLASGAEHR
jgi:excisionase family DNA binding protein